MKKRLRLEASEPLSIKGNYRLSVAMVTDLSSLSKTVKKRLDKIFEAVDEEILLKEKEDFELRVSNGFEPVSVDAPVEEILTALNNTVVSNKPNITFIKLSAEFKKYSITVPYTLKVRDLVSVIKIYPQLINSSLMIAELVKTIKYHGIPVAKSLTVMDFINVFSLNTNAVRNTDRISSEGTTKDIEIVLVENISEKTFTKQYTMVLGSLLQTK
jgi:hypothetical protein